MNAWSSKRDLRTSPSRHGCYCSLFYPNNILVMYLFLTLQECLGDRVQPLWGLGTTFCLSCFCWKGVKEPCCVWGKKPRADTPTSKGGLPVRNKGKVIAKRNCAMNGLQKGWMKDTNPMNMKCPLQESICWHKAMGSNSWKPQETHRLEALEWPDGNQPSF